MLVSHRHSFIFVHVPKAAGRSIKHALKPFSDLAGGHIAAWSRRLKILRPLPEWQRGLPDHANIRQIRDAAPSDFFAAAFKFAVVRNPWEWYVSMYHYLRDNATLDIHSAGDLDFADFVESEIAMRYHTTQRNLLVDERGELLVDFVGHYETLAEDFDHIRRKIGIHTRLHWRNRSAHRDYRDYYTPRLWKIVADRCWRDAVMFGYDWRAWSPFRTHQSLRSAA